MSWNQKHVFWQALVLALIIFNIGVFLGFMLEKSRANRISGLYAESEIDLLDIKVITELYDMRNLDCRIAIQSNINFADKVYEEAKLLQDYEDASRMTENLKLQHKKYDLLRTLFWINSMNLKQRCNASYHNIVYIYKYNDPSVGEEAEMTVISRTLGEIKEKYKEKVMLIPIAGDNNIDSLEMLKNMYNITSLPTIIIDEKFKILEPNKEEIEKYLK